jgi:hypothetical protein
MAKKVVRGNGWSLTIDGEKLLMSVSRASDHLSREMSESFAEIAQELERRVKRGMTDYSPGKKGPKSPVQVRTGKLAQSVVGESDGDVAYLRAGNSHVRYAAMQEFGKKNHRANPPKKFLRIPLPYVLTPAGDTKGKYQIYKQGKDYVTGGGLPTFIRGKAIMVMEGGKARALYALKESVDIPARLGMGTTIEDGQKMIRTHIIQGVNRALRLEKGGGK